MKTNLKVLSIEDSEDDVILLRRNLTKGGFIPEIKQITSEHELEEALTTETWDVAICDFLMPNLDAKTALRMVREFDPDLPLIILSGTISDETAVSMMKSGAQDYILKDNLSRLVPAIRRELKEAIIRKEKRLAEEALKDSEVRHRLLVESMSDIMFVIDSKGYVTEYYSKKSLIPNTEPDEMLGKHLRDLFDTGTASVFLTIISKVQDLKQAILFDYVSHQSGTRNWYSATLSPHEDQKQIVINLRNISELKSTEEQLRAANHMARLYLDIMSHDIRNYLQEIMLSADLMSATSSSEEKNRILYIISDSISKCEHLIENIAITAELPMISLESRDIVSVVSNSIRKFNESQEEIAVHFVSHLESGEILADKYLSNLIFNLLDNAATHGKGKTSNVWVNLRPSRGGYELTIEDDGSGITDERKKVLFNPERRFGGVGIHQAKQIVTKYGGTIEVRDRVEDDYSKGAQFILWIPHAEIP